MSRPGAPGVVVAFHDAGVGGPLRSHERELAWLAERTELTVLLPGRGAQAPFFDRLRELGAELVRGPYEALAAPRSVAGLARGAARTRRERRWFSGALEQRRPRLALAITSTLPAFLLAARDAGVPSIVDVSELWVGAGRGRARELGGRGLLRLESRLADDVVACSDGVAAQFGPGARVTTIHPGIDEDELVGDGSAWRAEHRVPADAPLLACIGNLTRGRGQDVLLEALPVLIAEWPGLRCAIQGDPFPRGADVEFAAELDRMTAELGLGETVLRLGVGPVGPLLHAADAVVNPATGHAETFARVPFEAGLAGTPAVCTRVGVIPELHTDGETALLVDPGDPAALAVAIARVLRDPALGERLAAGAAERARSIASPERQLAAYVELLERRLRLGAEA